MNSPLSLLTSPFPYGTLVQDRHPPSRTARGPVARPEEFAVHLEQVVAGTAPRDYVEPDKFFSRNYFSKALVDHCGMVLRRLNGETMNTASVMSLITQFGGGKTHTLTALYHLCSNGAKAKNFSGVAEMMRTVGLKTIPDAKVAVFVGNSWDASPGRETPWMEIADQLAGEAGRKLFDQPKKAPGDKKLGDLIRLAGKPVLILFDETLNYLGRYPEQATAFHSFMQNITTALTSAQNAVGIFSLPASPTEMTEDLREWQDKLTKVVGRVGKDLVANDASEVSEIVRRRLFENPGRDSMRRAVARQFASWVFERRDRLPAEWGQMSEDQIRAQFESCYPFHPSTLTVFQRKWQALPQFQQTRTTLAMLGMWISCAYREGYGSARREPLLTLGSAPLGDREFLSAVLRQMGEQRLQAAMQADISAPSGQPPSHAETLDEETGRRCGQARVAPPPRGDHPVLRVLRRADGQVGPPARALLRGRRPGHRDHAHSHGGPEPGTALLLPPARGCGRLALRACADAKEGPCRPEAGARSRRRAAERRRAGEDGVQERGGNPPVTVPEGFNGCARPGDADAGGRCSPTSLGMAARSPPFTSASSEWTRKCGQSSRQNPGGVLWLTCESGGSLRLGCEELMAWQAVAEDANRGLLGELESDDLKRIQRELSGAKSQIEERVWSSYNHLLLWDANQSKLKDVALGQLHPSEAKSITSAILARLRHDSLLSREIGASYIERNWPPALKESGTWPLASLKAAFFQGYFTRLEKADDALRQTISRAVSQGTLGLACGKDANSRRAVPARC